MARCNAKQIFRGFFNMMRMAKHILLCLAGDQVTISYVNDLSGSVKDRQQMLRKGWDFTCQCPRCTVDMQLPKSIHAMTKNLQDQLNTDDCKPGSILAQYR